MANLEFCVTHNMVAYLKKLEGSEGFHQIVDFLNARHIRYALTENPTIYVSLIKQFWKTATTRTLDNGEIELTAKIDGKVKIVTEASVRRHLQLEDSDGISSLPTTKIFERLSLIGRKNIQESVVPQPRSPTQPPVADEAASTGVDVRYRGATTTVTGLEVGQGSGNINKTPTMPQDSPLPRVNTHGSDEGSMTLQELMVLCTTLSKKVESLETDLKQTKLTYGSTYTKLIKKVKKLENKIKSSQARRRGRHEHDMEFDFDLDDAKDVSTTKPVYTAGVAVTTASVAVVSTTSPIRRVSTADDITMAETLVYIRKSATKGKEAVRLQAELEEEESQIISRVHEAAISFNVEEWEDIQARVEADEELAQRLQAEEREMFTEVEQARMLTSESSEPAKELKDKEEELSQEELQQMMIIVPKQGINVEALQTMDDLVMLWSLVKERFNSTEPADDKEREIWVEVHHVTTEKGIDINMQIEKEYPLSRGTLTQILVAKVLV
ncbi:hypothetical protein Tco_0980129 [Tanacetum coccineum]